MEPVLPRCQRTLRMDVSSPALNGERLNEHNASRQSSRASSWPVKEVTSNVVILLPNVVILNLIQNLVRLTTSTTLVPTSAEGSWTFASYRHLSLLIEMRGSFALQDSVHLSLSPST